ncbi:hypothetical protein [Streptomyces sp. NPDC001070]
MIDVSSSSTSPVEQSTGSLRNPEVNGTTMRSPPGRVTVSGGTREAGGASVTTSASAAATSRAGTTIS